MGSCRWAPAPAWLPPLGCPRAASVPASPGGLFTVEGVSAPPRRAPPQVYRYMYELSGSHADEVTKDMLAMGYDQQLHLRRARTFITVLHADGGVEVELTEVCNHIIPGFHPSSSLRALLPCPRSHLRVAAHRRSSGRLRSIQKCRSGR